MASLLVLLALVGGALVTVQVGVYGLNARYLGSRAEIVALATGLAALLVYVLAARIEWPSRAAVAAAPWWTWTGGVLGASYVLVATVVGPRLGASAFVALVVVGQLLSALLVDHYGWIGFPQHPITLARATGGVLLLCGALLIVR
jgi:bacterial/archaeal transporter family-2 protein